MRLLLDTQVWLWSIAAPDHLSDEIATLLIDEENELILSAASVWEIAIKAAAGKLKFTGKPEAQMPGYITRSGVQPLAMTAEHALRAAALPPHHRDPFDRILVAQAQLEELVLVSADRQFESYDVERLPA